MSYPVFVTCRDQVTYLDQLVKWLEKVGNAEDIFLLDNASTYEPLLDYYKHTPHGVIYTGQNYGHTVAWASGSVHLAAGKAFISSDSDVVPTETCPLDALQVMQDLLDTPIPPTGHTMPILKVGFSLKIDDLPDHYNRKQDVINHESQFWNTLDPAINAYRSAVDGTFALHQPWAVDRHWIGGIRTPLPYVARHMPWYEDSANLTEEQQYYRDHVNPAMAHWSGH